MIQLIYDFLLVSLEYQPVLLTFICFSPITKNCPPPMGAFNSSSTSNTLCRYTLACLYISSSLNSGVAAAVLQYLIQFARTLIPNGPCFRRFLEHYNPPYLVKYRI